MTPLLTTLTGSHGIRCGLGRESITIDCADIPDDALTVAIKGDNGMGKSTLFNLALTPWRVPPCIDGNIYEQFGETGRRELLWSHGEEQYRSIIEYRNTGKTKSQKAYLQVLDSNAAWQPLTLPDHTVSDGKSSTYDACLTHILGDQDVYYLSAFRAQGAPKLAEYEDPKRLMRALLNLDEPATMAAQAKEVVKGLRRELDRTHDDAAEVERHPEEVRALEADVIDLDFAIKEQATVKAASDDEAAFAKAELEQAIAGDIDRQQAARLRDAAQKRVRAATEEADRTARSAQREVDAVQGQIVAQNRRIEKLSSDAEQDKASAQAAILKAEALLSNRAAIAQAELDMASIDGSLQGKVESQAVLSAKMDKLRDLAGDLRAFEASAGHKASAGKAQRSTLDSLIARAAFVDAVPCRGVGEYAGCPALQDAIDAGKRVEQERDACEKLRDEWHDITGQIKRLREPLANYGSTEARLAEVSKTVASLRKKLADVQRLAAGASGLQVAEQNMVDAKGTIAALEDRLKRDNHEHLAAIAELNIALTAAKERQAASKTDADLAVAQAQRELDLLPDLDAGNEVTMAKAKLAAAEDKARQAAASIEAAIANNARCIAEIKQLHIAMEKGEAILARVKKLEQNIADWYLLEKGMRGVIDLSIEDAGPSIAAIANDLLSAAYGPRFSVRIVTQREQANGKTVETFDISVIDADSNMESSILKKSGGEAVILDRCLTDAAALYQQDTAGVNYETAFADEADGALSAENRRMFHEMERRAMEIGRYGRKFFVSHNPEAWEQADHVIDLAQYREAA